MRKIVMFLISGLLYSFPLVILWTQLRSEINACAVSGTFNNKVTLGRSVYIFNCNNLTFRQQSDRLDPGKLLVIIQVHSPDL